MARIGLRIFSQINRPPKALIDSFAGIPAAYIADNLNHTSCMDAKIRPVNDIPLLGPAFTVKLRPGDNLMLHKALDIAQPGDIVVVDAQGDLTNSVMGELMVLWAKQRGIGGFIIDGAIRDIGALKKTDMPIYAAGVTPAGPYKDAPGEINVPVDCGGVLVHPGDILVGDEDGIVVINPCHAPNLLEKSLAKSCAERKAKGDIASMAWDRTWLDQALKERGVIIENRNFPRTNVHAPVKIIVNETDHHIDALAINISMDGILLQAEQQLEPDLSIRLCLPEELGNIDVAAKVTWQQGNNIGCRFVDLSEDNTRAIFDLVLYLHLQRNPG
ncbi:MAG TPA: PilZ domain-containing protein [Methylomusa anaerophila]|uniref:Putative 4-hydroxy-4-methyl-2-oxoglutarate aldolase n=1 Tax=Methylomusa anaerophila TaxID=1930071 RepID=A0A348AFN4_9FIRM|nr:PilZ domain-containing protein [Methylomusa anaerophila]BBB89882.1 4-hydroxy-4-methyl-2-oxoglutarate aldolase [Methylomusa anaerophila]HML89071.1 PilZ domain-containing protein [Methylomusa anaerophila]